MKASEFVFERKKRKSKPRWAAWGPGPYGGYGFATGYSGDDGVGEASYPGNLGMMELAKFFQIADDKQKDLFKQFLEKGKKGLAWKLVQDITNTKLQGKEFDVEEGWKDWAAAGALGTALALGNAGDADAATKTKIKDPISQVSKKEIAKSVTGNPHEVYLKKAAEKAGIKGQELAAFLAQCAHETLDFKRMTEIGGSLDFRKYDPKYSPRKAKVLGNTKPGDGAKYKGRGYIQLTGKYNYKQAGEALNLPLVEKPELLEKPEIAAKAAVWYWKTRVAPKVDNFKDTKTVTAPINPGMKHLDQRKEKHHEFKVAMR